MVNKDEWRQIEEWVYQALELSEPKRKQMLQSLLENHKDLGKEVMALVEAHEHIACFLEPPLRFSLLKAHRETKPKASLPQDHWKKMVLGFSKEQEEITDS